MAKKNNDHIGSGLELLRKALEPYVKRQLMSVYKEKWWSTGADPHVSRMPELKNKIAKAKDDDARLSVLDIAALLTILNNAWGECFAADLGNAGRSHVNELRDVRNKWAHQDIFSLDDTHRAFDTMTRLLEMVGAPERLETAEIARKIMAEINEQSKSSQPTLMQTPSGASASLKPWREVATPHPDVASGKFQQAEFAADLFQVITDRASEEYKNPKEFFRRTYFTDGLSHLLGRAWLRLSGVGGDPVVELQTNFGGGKTHSLLALYHLFSGKIKASDVEGIENVSAQTKNLPDKLPIANRAVITCDSLSVDEAWKKPDGTLIRTLWGEMAWQLGGKEGYKMVAEADKQSVSPGSEKLTRLFEQYGPALVLIDEWVVYARKIMGKDNLPAGTFDTSISFVQELTQAAKAAKTTLIVAAIPASDAELGGENGRIALDRIRNVFGRLETIWKPASAEEAFEIVRRRLFDALSEKNEKERNKVCHAFAEMYRENRGDFPPECREADYEERLKRAYPIHPELFDRLYQDWSTLERFQLTRGVLRMMASVIFEMWSRGDHSLMIMPSNLPLDSQVVRAEFTRHLPDGWSGVIDKDIDGSTSRPFQLDNANPNLGRYHASRRVARAIFIGSAPSNASQRIRGLEEVRVKLSCAQPGEAVSTFGDALRRISDGSSYLYSDNSRYWFDTRITIDSTARDRAAIFERKPQIVEDEIIRRVREIKRRDRGEFASIHDVPDESGDVPDETSCRLVILNPKFTHRARQSDSKAIEAAQDILEHRGNAPRLYRNMLIFLAADPERLAELQEAVRLWKAWTSIEEEKEQLDLPPATERRVKQQIQSNEATINERMKETFCHMLVPVQEGTSAVEWQSTKLQGDNIIGRVSKKLTADQSMILKWSPALLRNELDKWLWKEKSHINVKNVWEYFAQYIYLPRLKDEEVFIEAIREGVGSLTWKDYFAYASAVREDGHYVGLVVGANPSITLDAASVLVKPEVAQKQREKEIADEARPSYVIQSDNQPSNIKDPTTGVAVAISTPTLVTHFHGTVELDPTRLGRDAGRVADEVVAHLTSLAGAKAKITLEIDVEVGFGIPEDRIRIVSENSNTLKFKSHGFE
jgi:predicted AAA+ superfamily ATPase